MTLARRTLIQAGLAAAALPGLRPAAAQAYPARPLRFVISFAAGGANDISARIVADELGKALGQQVVPDNRPGAGGNIAAEIVARAAPDGYTLFWAQAATHGINPSLYKTLPFDPIADFAPVALVGRSPVLMVAANAVPATSLAELIALAKARPGQLNFGSGGNGTTPHMAGELLKTLAGINLVHVPYSGSPAAINDVLAGRLDVYFDGTQPLLQHVRAGAMRALGVTTRERNPALPDVPTIAETVPGYEAVGWTGVVAPARTPAEIVARLDREINAIVATPAVRERFAQLGVQLTGGSAAVLREHIAGEIAKWRRVVEATGAKLD